ncbi:sigma-70 family RNA polymerase sigma factor [Gemmata sp.]|uniref:sigma-70 family RNA polymerase sigma factor n=1 Tax=Gemmata sp. TaxID=1914242 RepID=UPI003F6F23D7
MGTDADTATGAPAAPAADKHKLFLRTFLQNERRLYAYILALVPHRADADDVLQETSIVMWDKFDPAEPPTEFLAWGRRVAYHKVLDHYKKAGRARARLSQAFLDRVSEAAASADVSEADARRDALARCVERLQPKHRDLLARRFADGATTQSTSEQVGRSVEAVYKSLAKIRQTLFDCVQQTLAREAQA